jgi:hypothetical protein
MSAIVNLIRSFWRLFIWAFVVLPWEQALRVRLGKHRKLFGAGAHFRIPYLDRIYVQTVRLRYSFLPLQTVTSSDGQTFSVSGQLGYEVTNLALLYDTLHHAEGAVCAMAQGEIARYVQTHSMRECEPESVRAGVIARLTLDGYGLTVRGMELTTFARVKTYRLLSDQHYNMSSDALSTNQERVEMPPSPV